MNDLLEIIKMGGPVTAVSGLFLWYFDRLDKRTKNLLENHLQHVTESMNKNTVVLERLSVLLGQVLDKRTVQKWQREIKKQ